MIGNLILSCQHNLLQISLFHYFSLVLLLLLLILERWVVKGPQYREGNHPWKGEGGM